MKTLTTLLCLPILALGAALPAQNGEGTPKQEPKADAEQPKQSPKADKARKDDKVTKGDPAIRAIDKFIEKADVNTKKASWKQTLKAPPKVEFSEFHDYFWHLHTDAGVIKIRYFADTAPEHVTSGIYLSRLGFYDGLNFHRIIPGFMAQGGCPTGTGTGNPGFFLDGEFEGGRKHDKKGLLSMANTGRPRSDGAQFFLTFVPTPHLDGKHTIWGEVVDGMDALTALEKLGTQRNNGMLGRQGPKIVRTWVTVEAKKADGKDGGEKKDKGDGDER